MDARTTFPSSDFDHYYSSYPLSHISKTIHEAGNKIIMPPSALNQLASLSVSYPMLFRIQNTATGLHSHCGVVEFTADEGFVFMPTWLMNNLQLQEGQLVNIKNISLLKGKYIKIQPHVTKFTTISDHKSLLEKAFREFVCLTTGDTIVVNHAGEKYMVDIVETKPLPAVLLFETDCEVDFAPPLDYKEIEKKSTIIANNEDTTNNKDSKLFPGSGRRLGGLTPAYKKLKITELTPVVNGKLIKKGEVEIKAFMGVARRVDEKINEQGFKAFQGKSYRLI